jgi:hypothetical protein
MHILKKLAALLGIATASSLAAPPEGTPVEQAVVVHFAYGSKDLQHLFALEAQLEAAIVKTKVGQYDGNEVAVDGSDGYLYMYGPSADRLFEVVKPILEASQLMRGAKVKKRYGPAKPGVREVILFIKP